MTIRGENGEPLPMPTDIRGDHPLLVAYTLDVSGGGEVVSIEPADLEPGYHGEGALADFDPGSGYSSQDDWLKD